MSTPPSTRELRHGFSLVEVLVVLAILAILTALSVPALSSVMNSYQLSTASQAVMGQLTYARQDALANNRAVQIRFYQLADFKGTAVYRALQPFRETTDAGGNSTFTPIAKTYFLPTGMWFAYSGSLTTASTLFNTTASGAISVSTGDSLNPLPPPFGVSPYLYFRFRPTGQTDLTTSSLLTLSWENAPTKGTTNLPANFITLQIDNVNGSVRAYQP